MVTKVWQPYAWQARELARAAIQVQPSECPTDRLRQRALLARNDLGVFGEHSIGRF